MKKYLALLLFFVLVTISFISCENPFYGYEGMAQTIIGYEYKFTSPTLKLARGNNINCEIYTIYNSPVYEQRDATQGDTGNSLGQVESINDGDTLVIYSYRYNFTDSEDKSNEYHVNYFKNNHKKYLKDSVLIIGPSKIYQYKLGDTLSLTVVNSMCP